MIRNAKIEETGVIVSLVKSTIERIYPKYYPRGAVDFFICHHKPCHIEADIEQQRVYVMEIDKKVVGTVTIKEKEIARLFVHPDLQEKGYGTQLLDFAEKNISDKYDTICLAASYPAKAMYRKRGYKEISFCKIETENGDFLCYDQMEKLYVMI